jgi:hypothetical protein
MAKYDMEMLGPPSLLPPGCSNIRDPKHRFHSASLGRSSICRE